MAGSRIARIRSAWPLAAALLLAAAACGPTPSGTDDAPIDVSQAPVQTAVDAGDGTDPVRITDGDWEFVVTPLARYVLRGVVVSRENYSWGWNGRLAPCDVAMVWGELAEGRAWRRLEWSQDGRWYFWHWSGQPPFPAATIVRSSSNTHIVPANPNLRRAARSLGRGDVAELSGELVRIEGRRGAERITWRSSLSREDVGDGSCELLYLRRLRVNGKVYD
ncbi:MAG TPA: hypothetical protein VMT19_04035 [Thermoanaerobaculaceae bacterium]|nr:hypothetical protein [Thermoanaerobaculaceae bacterium]